MHALMMTKQEVQAAIAEYAQRMMRRRCEPSEVELPWHQGDVLAPLHEEAEPEIKVPVCGSETDD